MILTCPSRASPAVGETIATGGASCRASRKNRKGKKVRNFFITRTSKFATQKARNNTRNYIYIRAYRPCRIPIQQGRQGNKYSIKPQAGQARWLAPFSKQTTHDEKGANWLR